MELTLNLPPEELQLAADKAARDLLEEGLAGRLVSTKTAAALLEVSENQFLTMASAKKMKRVMVGPRMTRWKLADVNALIASFPTEE